MSVTFPVCQQLMKLMLGEIVFAERNGIINTSLRVPFTYPTYVACPTVATEHLAATPCTPQIAAVPGFRIAMCVS